jgi:hypothetical protein
MLQVQVPPIAELLRKLRPKKPKAAPRSKISSLPPAIREELNQRLHDGQRGKQQVLPWVNSLPEVKAILAAEFDGLPITEQNLSEWRRVYFPAWLEKRERAQQP